MVSVDLDRPPVASSRPRGFLRAATFAASFAAVGMLGASAQAASGRVAAVAGDVTLVRGELSAPLVRGAEVHGGDTLVTGANGRAQLLMSDRSLLNLGAGTHLTIAAYEVAARSRQRRVSLRLLLGRLWARVSSSTADQADYIVETHNAVAGVRGTELVVDVDETGRSEVTVLSGVVQVGPPSGEGVEVLRELQRGTVGADAKVAVTTVTAQEARALTAALGPSVGLQGTSESRLESARSADAGAPPEGATTERAAEEPPEAAPPLDIDPANRITPAGETPADTDAHVRGRVEVVP